MDLRIKMFITNKIKKKILDFALLTIKNHLKNQKNIDIYIYNKEKDEISPCNFKARSITNLSSTQKSKTNDWGNLEQIIDFKDKTVIDIGANVGFTTTYFSKISNNVIAFEPDNKNFEYLNSQIKIRNLKNVEAHNLAVSNVSGPVEFYYRNSNDLHSLGVHNKGKIIQTSHIAAISLDDFWGSSPQQIGLIKIDVEGFEFEVLQGASKLLEMRLVEAIIFEYSPKIHKLRKISEDAPIKLLKKYNYRIFDINGFEIIEDDLVNIKVCDLIALNPEHSYVANIKK